MKLIIERSVWLVLIMLLGIFSSEAFSEEIVKFSFSPGKQIDFIQKLTATKEKDMGKLGKQIDESVSTTKISITQTKLGWDVLAQPISMSMYRNGKEINNPLASLLSSAIITYKLDAAGSIKDVEGYEIFIEQISKTISPVVFKQLAPVLSIESLKAKDIAEYNGRIGDYLGAEVKIGDSFITSTPFQLPNGSEITYNVKTNISAIEPCGTTNCVRINQVYNSKADNIAKISGDVLNNISKAVAPEMGQSNSKQNTAAISGTVSRLIDPATMLIHEEKTTRIIEIEINIPNTGLVPVQMTEKREYVFEF